VVARLGPVAEPRSASDTHLRLRAITRLRHAARFFLRRRALDAGECEIADRLADVYSAISEQTGAQVIIDSSKLPTYAALLDEVENLDVYVLHLVRDPRAAAYSWSLGRSSSSLEEMDELAPVKSSALWGVWNGLTSRRWGSGPRYLRLRYEDVMADPQGSLRKIANFVEIDPDLLPFTADDEVMLAPGHVLAGNPNRRNSGRVRFRLDRRWETGLRRRDRYLVTSVCAVLLHRMGYSLRVRQ
jgi:hypothetical protein